MASRNHRNYPTPSDHEYLLQNYYNVCHVIKELSEIIKTLEQKIMEIERNQETKKVKVQKKCKYFNSGYCNKRESCPFAHPDEICQEHLSSGKCENYRYCQRRHHRECRNWARDLLCFQSCAYLHKESVQNEDDNRSNVDTSTAKLITIEVNGKKVTVEKLEELD